MLFTNIDIARIRAIATMTEEYFIIENGETRPASYEEVMRNTGDSAIYLNRAKWLELIMPEVRKETGIIAFSTTRG